MKVATADGPLQGQSTGTVEGGCLQEQRIELLSYMSRRLVTTTEKQPMSYKGREK